MSPETAVIVNRWALVLGFVSFWLVAPEILGEARLRRWEANLALGVQRFPRAAIMSIVVLSCVAALVWTQIEIWPTYSLPESQYLREFLRRAAHALMAIAVFGFIANLVCLFLEWLEHHLIPPLLRFFRTRCLSAGAALFVLSMGLQFAATLQTQTPNTAPSGPPHAAARAPSSASTAPPRVFGPPPHPR
jgi:hypothetical protein